MLRLLSILMALTLLVSCEKVPGENEARIALSGLQPGAKITRIHMDENEVAVVTFEVAYSVGSTQTDAYLLFHKDEKRWELIGRSK